MDGPLIPDIDPIRVDVNGVTELLKSLEVHKADEIPAHPLKETSELQASCSISNSYLPRGAPYRKKEHWCSLLIVPIFKKGNHASIFNLYMF